MIRAAAWVLEVDSKGSRYERVGCDIDKKKIDDLPSVVPAIPDGRVVIQVVGVGAVVVLFVFFFLGLPTGISAPSTSAVPIL